MGVYDGWSQSQLQAQLAIYQAAYAQLVAGQSVATGSYGQGDGSKSVTFRQTDRIMLKAEIMEIQRELGTPCRQRRSPRFYF